MPKYVRGLLTFPSHTSQILYYFSITYWAQAHLYDAQGKYAEAEPLYKRSLKIWEKALGPEHPDVATSLSNLAELYRQIGKEDEAEILETRARKIGSK